MSQAPSAHSGPDAQQGSAAQGSASQGSASQGSAAHDVAIDSEAAHGGGAHGGAAYLPAELPADWRDFFALTKPRVMSLVIFTGLCGLLSAPGNIHPVIGFTAILCIALGAGGAAALNQWWEADLDAGMKRTASRPLPAGKMGRKDARDFGLVLAFFSVMIMLVAVNWLSAVILAISIVYYAVVYTIWLKPRTPQNIVIGGGAGAFPPVIGWVAVTGDITAMPILLFAIIFFWTPPHFWALALFVQSDYAKVGIPMMPVVRGEASTRRQILLYSLILLPLSAAPWMIGGTTALYGVSALILSTLFLLFALPVAFRRVGGGNDGAGGTDGADGADGAENSDHKVSAPESSAKEGSNISGPTNSGPNISGPAAAKDSMKPEKRLFAYSVLYLFVLFAALTIDRVSFYQGWIS